MLISKHLKRFIEKKSIQPGGPEWERALASGRRKKPSLAKVRIFTTETKRPSGLTLINAFYLNPDKNIRLMTKESNQLKSALQMSPCRPVGKRPCIITEQFIQGLSTWDFVPRDFKWILFYAVKELESIEFLNKFGAKYSSLTNYFLQPNGMQRSGAKRNWAKANHT